MLQITRGLKNAKAVKNTSQVAAFGSKSWVPSDAEKLQKVTTAAVIAEVAEEQREIASRVVPWFLTNMPAAYFRQVPDASRSQHIKAVTAIRELSQSDMLLKIQSKVESENALQTTFISSQTQTGLLHSQIKNLVVPEHHELSNVKVFSSLDGALALNIFTFHDTQTANKASTWEDAKHVVSFIEDVKAGKHANEKHIPAYNADLFSEQALREYIPLTNPTYLQNVDPRRFMIHRGLYEKVKNSDGSVVHIEAYKGSMTTRADSASVSGDSTGYAWITVAAANVLPEVLLRLTSAIVSARGLDISRAHLDSVDDPLSSTPEFAGHVTLLRLLVNSTKETIADWSPNNEFVSTLKRDLTRAKWLDNETTDLGLNRHPKLGLDKAEIITALCSMLHGPLSKQNAQAFASIKSILQSIDSPNHMAVAEQIASLFLDRFNTNGSAISSTVYDAREHDLRGKINNVVNDASKTVLRNMLEAVRATLRTNFFREERYALSMRVNPSIMVPLDSGRPQPFGVFFIHGRHFNGFHCRFQDIARGGLRVVTPANSDQYALESTRQFDEAYGLSFAQQLKNKDIPEGGSKGVILVNAPSIEKNSRPFAMRKSVKGFTDAMLDLIVKDSVKNLVDFYGKDELIYLGPDEQIIPSDIEWIIKRAEQRGYPIPAAFMSSKAENGINHKVYGVTSEGIAVYLDVALRKVLNINPDKDSFTIKITGGPDGDVAGNLMKILFRDYGRNPKVVGVADGFGVAEDPEGLDSGELLRLFEASLPITSFDRSKLSRNGILMTADTPEGLQRRNSMHFRVKADAFVPAGGRPNSINAENWQQFLLEDGKTPSSKLIVEGANIFTTPEARKLLFEKAKVAIVKDSSANKCGVVTSSCEVQASMLISKKEFVDNKQAIVDDVLVKLRQLARLEGELLFREYANYRGSLPSFSERISYAIGKATTAITAELEKLNPEDALFQELSPLIREALPKKLDQLAGDKVATHFPVQYQRNAIACALASKLVYQEGIHLVESQPEERLAARAVDYYRAENKVKKVIADLDKVDFGAKADTKKEVQSLLAKGGARTILNIF